MGSAEGKGYHALLGLAKPYLHPESNSFADWCSESHKCLNQCFGLTTVALLLVDTVVPFLFCSVQVFGFLQYRECLEDVDLEEKKLATLL